MRTGFFFPFLSSDYTWGFLISVRAPSVFFLLFLANIFADISKQLASEIGYYKNNLVLMVKLSSVLYFKLVACTGLHMQDMGVFYPNISLQDSSPKSAFLLHIFECQLLGFQPLTFHSYNLVVSVSM